MSENHSAEALVLTCIDFRFHEQIVKLLHERGINSFDLKCDAGAVKYLVSDEKPAVRDWILENIEIAKRLHHISQVVLINHYDCGAYGGNSAFESDEAQLVFHREQLAAARTKILVAYPDLAVKTFFAKPVEGKLDLISA
ncbi:MAG: hypothetical protein Q8N81_08015 [bacterium]|nr:hypothetical protein [bacterium]